MEKHDTNVYLPDQRTDYAPKKNSLVSQSPEGISTALPNPVEDPIVVNNISCPEFDYTEDDFQGPLNSNP